MPKLKKLTLQERYHAVCEQHVREMEKHEVLFKLIRDDLRMRPDENGNVNISNFIWRLLNEVIDE